MAALAFWALLAGCGTGSGTSPSADATANTSLTPGPPADRVNEPIVPPDLSALGYERTELLDNATAGDNAAADPYGRVTAYQGDNTVVTVLIASVPDDPEFVRDYLEGSIDAAFDGEIVAVEGFRDALGVFGTMEVNGEQVDLHAIGLVLDGRFYNVTVAADAASDLTGDEVRAVAQATIDQASP